MMRSLTTTALVALIAAPAAAEGVDYARLSFDYRSFDGDTVDTDNSILQGAVDYSFGQVVLFAEFETFTFMPSVGDDESRTSYNLGAGYAVTPEILVGGGIIGFSDEDDDFNGFEGFAQYQTAGLAFGVNASKFDADADNVTTQFFGEVEATPAISFGAALSTNSEFDGTGYRLSSDFDQGPIAARVYLAGNSEQDDGIFGLRGTYEVTPDIRGGAAFNVVTGIDDDVSFISVGAGYRVVEGLWADAYIGQFSDDAFGGESVSRLSLELTYEIGERVRVDRRFFQDASDDNLAGLF